MAKREEAKEKYKVIDGVKHKLCSTCKKYRPVTEFSSRSASPDGLAYSCKDCERATAQKSYAKKKQKNAAKQRYQENKEVYKERAKERYAADPETHLANAKEWRQSNKGKKVTREATARRAARIKAQTPGGKDYTTQEIVERDSVDGQCICQICFTPILDMSELQIDHIVGIAVGGADVKSNVRCAHKKCNLIRPKDASDL